jgi:hypothetical protein
VGSAAAELRLPPPPAPGSLFPSLNISLSLSLYLYLLPMALRGGGCVNQPLLLSLRAEKFRPLGAKP